MYYVRKIMYIISVYGHNYAGHRVTEMTVVADCRDEIEFS